MFCFKEKRKKEKKIPTIKIGTNKKIVIILWIVLISSVCFGIYKNFTAIDKHTIHEKEIIKLQLNDTNGIENFVKDFATSYYTWENNKEAIKKRIASINKYLTKDLQELNTDTIQIDIPTTSQVNDVQIWDIEQSGKREYVVTYEVNQQISEGEQTEVTRSAFTVTVHVSDNGNMVISKNPTIAPLHKKSNFKPKPQEPDGTVKDETIKDATSFLETFFKRYPTITKKELAYYVKDNALKPVNGDYTYFELINPVFKQEGKTVKVSVYVKFLDNRTKAMQISQYHLTLAKEGNWKIIS